MLTIFSNNFVSRVASIIFPTSSYSWVSVTGSVSTNGLDSAGGWIRFFARLEEWSKGWCVFSVPPVDFYGIGCGEYPPFNFTLFVFRIVNASIVKLNYTGSDFLVTGFWETNSVFNPANVWDVISLLENMTVALGELSVVGNWSSFAIDVDGYESAQGNITSYFSGRVRGGIGLGYPYGDINDDGKIDMRDIGMVSRSFGSVFCFSLRYDFRADINFDFVIDMRDIGCCAKAFGVSPA